MRKLAYFAQRLLVWARRRRLRGPGHAARRPRLGGPNACRCPPPPSGLHMLTEPSATAPYKRGIAPASNRPGATTATS